MIQRYTCIPTLDYDVLVVTNGSVEQVEAKLIETCEYTGQPLPSKFKTIYFDSFKELTNYLVNFQNDAEFTIDFKGKIHFMFFDGLAFIQQFLSDAIDYYQQAMASKFNSSRLSVHSHNSVVRSQLPYTRLNDCYFYFDASIFDSGDCMFDDSFNSLVTIVNDVLKKVNFMVANIKGIFIDDTHLLGEKIYPIHCLLRNYPRIERIELSSNTNLVMNDLIF